MTDSTSMVRRQETALSAGREAFEVATKQAQLLAKSSMIPREFQGNPANVLVALEYANRLGASALAVMQSLDVIHGRPSLRASFLIGTVNASGRFSPIRYRWQGEEGTDSWGCRAWAIDREIGEECVGPLVTIGLAKAEGWYNKNGSKWKTIPELMLTYRAGAWWTRIYCPDLALGLHTTDELEDGPAPRRAHAQSVAAALHADDSIDEAEYVDLTSAPAEDAPALDPDPKDDRTQALNRKYFAMLNERGMSDEADRRAFQKRLHESGLVASESCTDWRAFDYQSAIAELEAVEVEVPA